MTLATGTTLSQAIPFLVSPLLTRIYSPEEWGIFSLYMSLAVILITIATGRYELAIILPKSDKEAINIVAVCVFIACCLSVLFLFTVLLFKSNIAMMLGNPQISNWLFFLPLSILIVGVYQSFNYWSNRKSHYKAMSISKVLQTSVAAIAQIVFGLFLLKPIGLLLGTILGQCAAMISIVRNALKNGNEVSIFKDINITSMKATAVRYINFPKYLIVAHSLNIISIQLPILFLSTIYSSSIVGLFDLAQRTTKLPMILVGSAIGDVFRQKATEDYHQFGNCKEIYLITIKKLILISIIPLIILYFIAPYLFSVFFGDTWRISGEYVRLMTIMLFFQFISSPLSNMYMIAEKQKQDLILQVSILVLSYLSLYIGHLVFNNITYIIILYSSVNSLIYLVNIFITYQFAVNRKGAKYAKENN